MIRRAYVCFLRVSVCMCICVWVCVFVFCVYVWLCISVFVWLSCVIACFCVREVSLALVWPHHLTSHFFQRSSKSFRLSLWSSPYFASSNYSRLHYYRSISLLLFSMVLVSSSWTVLPIFKMNKTLLNINIIESKRNLNPVVFHRFDLLSSDMGQSRAAILSQSSGVVFVACLLTLQSLYILPRVGKPNWRCMLYFKSNIRGEYHLEYLLVHVPEGDFDAGQDMVRHPHSPDMAFWWGIMSTLGRCG